MDTNDFLGSFAQENVSFTTQVVRTGTFGQNYWTVMVFVESDRFVTADAAHGWEDAPGLPSCKVLVTTADNYAEYTKGLLASWLYDLFCNGFTGNCILVAPAASAAPDVVTYTAVIPEGTENPSTAGWYELNDSGAYVASTDTTVDSSKTYYTKETTNGFIAAMNEAYDVLKPYAYHKTVCAGAADSVNPEYAVALQKKCKTDTYLSGTVLVPQTSPDLTAAGTMYPAFKAAGVDAFMAWHSDSTRNGALYSLGLALAAYNGSGTPVGNGMDMTSSSNITPSNNGVNPTSGQKSALKSAFVQYFKTVGDNSLSVAAETDRTILGGYYAADWILAYLTYTTKVTIAQLITQRNFYRNDANYTQICAAVRNGVDAFANSGVLTDIAYSFPSFDSLPTSAGDEIIIPNAWSATYVNHVRKVTISGTLYIGD